MTHQEKLTKVTEAIHKACPDLLKLKVGAKMKNLHQDDENPYQVKTFLYKSVKYYHCLEHDGRTSKFPFDALQILGQPIGIAEVLRAFSANRMLGYVQASGMIYHEKIPNNSYVQYWNLEKNTLDQQEEPVISLLYSIFYS